MKSSITKNGLHKVGATFITAASLICGSLVIPACDSDEAEQSITKRYSGEELYAGLMFDAGPAAGKVAALTQEAAREEVEQMTEEEFAATLAQAKTTLDEMGMEKIAGDLDQLGGTRKEVLEASVDLAGRAEITALVISMIKAEDPGFFDDFAERIQSGDHYLVAEAMTEARTQTLTHLLDLGLNVTAPADADRGLCIIVAYLITFVATFNVLVNVNVAININVTETIDQVFDSVELSRESMRTDVIIDQITAAYAS